METISLISDMAEERTLGSCLKSEAALIAVMDLGLKPEHFGGPTNEIVFRAIMGLRMQGKHVNADTVKASLDAGDKLDLIGGAEVIDRLTDNIDDHDYAAGDYAEIVMDRRFRRDVHDFIQLATNHTRTIENKRELVTGLEREFYKLVDGIAGQTTKGLSAKELMELYQQRREAPEMIPYPFSFLNDNGGRERGSLTVWGGYPSDGKSIIGMQSGVAAAQSGYNVGYFSLEMTEEQLLHRLLAMNSAVPMDTIMEGPDDTEALNRIDTAAEFIRDLPLQVFFDPDLTAQEIRSVQMREKFDLVIIDYLQRLPYTEWAEVGRMVKLFKNMALSTRCAVDVLSQVNPQQVNGGLNPYTVPNLFSLFGGKMASHEADNVYFVYPERISDGEGGWRKTGAGDIINVKKRSGITGGKWPVVFDSSRIMWREIEDENNLLRLP